MILEVSEAVYAEIRARLVSKGHAERVYTVEGEERLGLGEVALVLEPPGCCGRCGYKIFSDHKYRVMSDGSAVHRNCERPESFG